MALSVFMVTPLLAAIFLAALEAKTLQVYSCSRNSGGNKMKILIMDVNPDPVKLPGNFTMGGTLEAMEDLNGSFSADVSVVRDSLIDITLPCIESDLYPGFHVGSCHYTDLCKSLSEIANMTRANGTTPYCERSGFPCSCPIPKGVYKMIPFQFSIPKLGLLGSLLVDGTYKIRIAVKNDLTGDEVACYQGQIKLGTPVHHNQTAILEGPTRTDGIDMPVVG